MKRLRVLVRVRVRVCVRVMVRVKAEGTIKTMLESRLEKGEQVKKRQTTPFPLFVRGNRRLAGK